MDYNCAVEPILSVGETGMWDAALISARTQQIQGACLEETDFLAESLTLILYRKLDSMALPSRPPVANGVGFPFLRGRDSRAE